MDDEAFKRRIGTVLSGKWRLDALLGTGGMASVYAATHVRNRLQTAVKILHPEVSREPQLRQRFLREGYVANSVKHPGVVQVFDDSDDPLEAYIVMELLMGQTLKQRWNGAGRKLPLDEVRAHVSGMLDVLVAAHAADIVHRDLKPDNVFLTDGGVLKVLDFGIARLREVQNAHEHQTNTGALLGTPAFMPPEQALGNWEEVDARTDLFAVAATAWVLLTGQLVHQAKGVSELLIAAATRKARPIKSLVENLPDPVAQVIDKGLSFDKTDRFADAQTMKNAWDAAFTVRRSPTLRMTAPSAQAIIDWSVRDARGERSDQSHVAARPVAPAPPEPTQVSTPTYTALMPRGPEEPTGGTTPVFDPTNVGRAPSIPARLFTTETPVSTESVARGSNKRALWVVGGLALTAVAAVSVIVVTTRSPQAAMNLGSATSSSTSADRSTATDAATPIAPQVAPSTVVSAAPPPTVAPSAAPSSTTAASSLPSASVSSSAPSAKPTTKPTPTRVLPGCEDPVRDFANNGQPCKARM